MKTHQLVRYTLTALLGLVAAACAAEGDDGLTLVGQFHDRNNDRVFAVTYRAGITAEEMRTYGKRATNSAGRMTAVYFFAEGDKHPADALKQAKTIDQATAAAVAGEGKYFIYQRAVTGKEQFVNCAASPQHELCQKG